MHVKPGDFRKATSPVPTPMFMLRNTKIVGATVAERVLVMAVG